jgi:uncharacterized RDD family membrane protein YckC
MRVPSLYRRLAAWVYEGLLLFAVCAITGLLFSLATHSTNALTHHVLLSGVLFFIIGGYLSWFWSKGQTLAMKTWRFKITDSIGMPISIRRAALRYVLSWLWFAPPLIALALTNLNKPRLYAAMSGWLIAYILMAWLHPSQQFLHDRLAGTRLMTTE